MQILQGNNDTNDNDRMVPDLCLCADNTSDYEATCDSIAPNAQEFDSHWDCRFDTADGEGALEFRVTSAILVTIVAIGLACWAIHRKQCAAASAQSDHYFVDRRQRLPEQATEIHGRLRQPPPRQIYWVDDDDLCHEFYSSTTTTRPTQATVASSATATNSDTNSSNVLLRNSDTNGTIAIIPEQSQLPIPPPTRIYWVEDELKSEFDLATRTSSSLLSRRQHDDDVPSPTDKQRSPDEDIMDGGSPR